MPDLPDVESYLDPAPRRRYDEQSALNLISKYESGDRNIPNYRFDPGHTAQGFHQITNTNWRSFGPRAGVDIRQYPSAMAAPRDVQEKVAGLMYRERGFQDWAPFNPRLKAAIARGEAGQQPTGVESYLDPLPQPTPQPRQRGWGKGPIGQGVTQPKPRSVVGAQVQGETAPPTPQQQVRSAIQASAPPGFSLLPESAQEWIGGAVAKGAPPLMRLGAGAIKTGANIATGGTVGIPEIAQAATEPVRRQLRTGAEQISRGTQAMDTEANRGFVSQTAQNVVAGSIGSAPAMVLTALGVPAPVAFGLQANLEAQGRDADLNDIIKETAQGTTIGALFELPVPAKLSLLQRIGYRAGTVGAGTFGVEKLTGAQTKDAATSALVNGLFAATGAGKRGPRETLTEPIPEARPEIPGVPETIPQPEAQAAPEVAPVRHVDLQRRLDDGKFAKEKAVEAEARRAQVTATPEPAPEELIRPPEAAPSPAELPPEAATTRASTAIPPELPKGEQSAQVAPPNPNYEQFRPIDAEMNDTGRTQVEAARQKLRVGPKDTVVDRGTPRLDESAKLFATEGAKVLPMEHPSDWTTGLGGQRVTDELLQAKRDAVLETPDTPITPGSDSFNTFSDKQRAFWGDVQKNAKPNEKTIVPSHYNEIKWLEAGGLKGKVNGEEFLRKDGEPGDIYKLGRDGIPRKVTGDQGPGIYIIRHGETDYNRVVSRAEPTREIKISKLALGVEAKAVERKLTEGFSDLPEYDVMRVREQAQQATDLLKSNPERAHRIAMGTEDAPLGLRPEAVFTAVENRALEKGDVETLQQLASSSTLPSEATAMGQRIRLLGERNPSSAVAAIRDVQQARESRVPNVARAKKTIQTEIKVELRRAAPKPRDWASFLETIKCK